MRSKNKRFLTSALTLLLALTMLFSLGITASAKTFSDVPSNHWGYKVIDELSEKGILNGYTDGSFKPSGTMSNVEFVSIITRAYCVLKGLSLPANATSSQKWYDPAVSAAVSYKIISTGQFSGKENSPIARSDMALLVSNALADVAVPSNVGAALDKFTDSSAIRGLSTAYQNAIAKLGSTGIVSGDDAKRFNPTSNMTRAEAATIVSNYLRIAPTLVKVEDGKILIAAAASLENAFKELIPEFNKLYPGIQVTGTYDASGKLQTQIESGLEADLFFSAALSNMEALKNSGLIDGSSVVNLLENKVVLIKTKGVSTKVTGFANVTEASTIAVGDPESVPAGKYAKEIFTSLGIWDAVEKKASIGTNVTEVLTWVAAGSAEVGVVYKTDALSKQNDVEIIAYPPAGSIKTPVIYPVGITTGSKQQAQAQAFLAFLQTPTAAAIFEKYAFDMYN